MVQQNVPRLNPSLGFVTEQEIQNTKNKNKKRRRNLDLGTFQPRVTRLTICRFCTLQVFTSNIWVFLSSLRTYSDLCTSKIIGLHVQACIKQIVESEVLSYPIIFSSGNLKNVN